MVKALYDTNILIDYLRGEKKAKKEMLKYDEHYISIITYIEVLVGVADATNHALIKKYLESFNIVDVGSEIADITIKIRESYKLKIPDAIILATANKIGAVLITRDTNDFNKQIPWVKMPY